ncbi:hypothetical protein KUM39_26660 [Streptomyces sp. J2-1]|uniref:Rv3654c family TadE-like protein n=1 Tax=Streptomyces corallincola TaxID=2851888 RepID=UPI001C391882|nr:Rv3654c family TadE-like protein [Streptomyces corallincola]MBV2357894.1 hypothetical protein [Streptomyces corallincola]
MSAGRREPSGDRGSATVWSVGVVALLCVVFGAVLALGQAVVVRHRAAGSADLAALTAADHWAEGEDGACDRARELAVAQGSRVVRCALTGDISDVTAAVGRGPFAAEVRARAGPAAPEPVSGPAPEPVSGPAPETDHSLHLSPSPNPHPNSGERPLLRGHPPPRSVP